MQTINYESFVKKARAAARDILRTRKVSALLGYIRTQEAKIKKVIKGRKEVEERHAKAIERSEKTLERAAYQLRHAEETGNPDVASFKTAYDEAKAAHEAFLAESTVSNTRELEDYDARGAEVTKAAEEKVAEYREKIANWQNGTSKVDFEEMVSLAEALMEGRITDAWNEGEYDDVEDDATSTEDAS